MGVEEHLFAITDRWWRRVMRRPGLPGVTYSRVEGRVRRLAQILAAGRPLHVVATDELGGVGANAVYLPTMLSAVELYVYRVWFAHTAHAQWPDFEAASSQHEVLATLLLAAKLEQTFLRHHCDGAACTVCALRAGAREAMPVRSHGHGVLGALQAWVWHAQLDVALLEPWQRAALAGVLTTGDVADGVRQLLERKPARVRWGQATLLPWGVWQVAADVVPAMEASPLSTSPGLGRELVAKIARRPHVLQKAPTPESENPVTQLLEKVQTLDDYQGGQRRMDGEDETADQAEALGELTLSTIVRTDEATQTVLRSDATIEGLSLELEDCAPEAAQAWYDEWDGARRRYRKAHCALTETAAVARPSANYLAWEAAQQQRLGASARTLSQALRAFAETPRATPRQLAGDQVDIDAVIAQRATWTTTGRTDERVYIARPKVVPDVALTLLMDVSLSTDGWIHNQRVFDVERDCLWLFSKALASLPMPVSVAGYCSHTRRDCRYHVVKQFDEAWTKLGPRLTTLRPEAYTRIGPAVRHATVGLAQRPERKKVLLLVTDAKPTDYDRYEGRYGVADVAQAVREAKALGIHTRALVIADAKRPQVREMFSDYEILSAPALLPQAIVRLLRQLGR